MIGSEIEKGNFIFTCKRREAQVLSTYFNSQKCFFISVPHGRFISVDTQQVHTVDHCKNADIKNHFNMLCVCIFFVTYYAWLQDSSCCGINVLFFSCTSHIRIIILRFHALSYNFFNNTFDRNLMELSKVDSRCLEQ